MSIDDVARGVAMGRRVVRTAARLGLAGEDLELLRVAHDRARVPREARLDDDHDPHYLHPGRTALILMLDTEESDPVVLAAALLAESERPDLRVATAELLAMDVSERLGAWLRDAVALRDAVPDPHDPELVERLVVAGEPLVRLAVAERLDQARHSHMWREGKKDAAFLDEVARVYGPLAERSHPKLAHRYRRWSRGTRRRLERER